MIESFQLKATYNAIVDYNTNASGANWDDVLGANIDKKNPASLEFWKGWTKASVSSVYIF